MNETAALGLYRRALDEIEDLVIVVDRAWRVVYANRAAEPLLGVPAGHAAGADVRRIAPSLLDADSEAGVAALLAGAGEERLRVAGRWLGRQGALVLSLDPAGVRLVLRLADPVDDDRSRVEAAILATVREGIYGVDADNRITFANAAAERLLGRPATAMIGRNSHALVHPAHADGSPYPESECPLSHTLRDGAPRDVEDVLWRADGTALPVEYHATAIAADGNVVGAVVSFRDLSEHHAMVEAQSAAAFALETLHELQLVLQPPPPVTEDPCLGVYYLPADPAGAGGDLYDWQSLPDNGIYLTVVDVVGHGLVAARDALALTHALRLLLLARTRLEQVVGQASVLLADAYPQLAATAIIADYNNGGRLRFVSAGHPPPLLVNPDGSARYIEAAGRPIGWPQAGTDEVAELVVPQGGRVVFYTDGLIEAGANVVTGMQALADLARDLRTEPPAVAAQALVTNILTGATRRDDCLALVLDRPAAG